MDWIESGGGPLVLLPASKAGLWRGASGAGLHYELACSVQAYAGVVPWEDVDVLVLDDAPLRAAVTVGEAGVLIVRWAYASNEEVVLESLRRIDWQRLAATERHVLAAIEKPYVLIDSAEPGAEASAALDVQLRSGAWEVLTFEYAPTADLGLILHAIRPLA